VVRGFDVVIKSLHVFNQYVVIENRGQRDVYLGGWRIKAHYSGLVGVKVLIRRGGCGSPDHTVTHSTASSYSSLHGMTWCGIHTKGFLSLAGNLLAGVRVSRGHAAGQGGHPQRLERVGQQGQEQAGVSQSGESRSWGAHG
jgi:hypothetical protein